KSDGIFSKIKNAFTYSESKTIPNDKVNLDNTINNSNNENNLLYESEKNVKDFFIASYNEQPVINDVNLDNKISEVVDVEDNPLQNSNDALVENHSNIFTQGSNSQCWSALNTGSNNYYTTGKRKVLFKVEKYKFDYPLPKTTTLYYYPNLPIIQSLELTTRIKHDNSQTTTITCNGQQVIVPIEFDYEEVTFKPYVSYSIALYNQKPPGLFDPSKESYDINNLDIYTLENDSLFLIPFTICFPAPAKNFSPSDFIVDISISDPLGGTVSPVCEFDAYYLYEVEVAIELKLSAIIDLSSIDSSTLNVLNTKLGKSSGNTLFSQGELNSVTSIDFMGLATLDYNIFNYLLNLEILNISNTNANINTSSNFVHLNNLIRLTTLIAENNYFTDYSAFALLTNLIGNLTTIDLQNTYSLAKPFSMLSISSGDITPLTMFINLTSLNLSNNSLSTLPDSIDNLSNLSSLNLSNNKLLSLPYQIGNLSSLITLDLSDNTNFNNESLYTIKISNKLQTLILSGNQISNLTSLAQYDIEIIALNQVIYYNIPQSELPGTYILDLENLLLDIDGDVPCIDYISNGGVCGPIESCDCINITWTDTNQIPEAYFTFSNLLDTFTGKVCINFELSPIS
ncbi:MAG: hypothetical protein ACRC3Y_07920, partial [Romboutsia sp.]